MNNSSLVEDFAGETPKKDTRREEREAKLVRLIEAAEAVRASREWSTLREELFDGLLENIETRMRTEADKADISVTELYRLQGERKVARKLQLETLIDTWRSELANIRKK